MAEDFGERTERATPRKRQEARERGQVARSADLAAGVLLLGAFAALLLWGERMAAAAARLVRACCGGAGAPDLTAAGASALITRSALAAAAALAPFVLVTVFLAFLGNFLQVGPLWAGELVRPDIGRISPGRGLRRLLGPHGAARTVMGILKIGCLAAVVYFVLARHVDPSRGAPLFAFFGEDLGGALARANRAACELGIACGAALCLLAVLDYGYRRWRHEADLRMTKLEVREEMRRLEGDPKIKERRRRIQRQIAFQRCLRDVPAADVVVTNPSEYAVALAYDEGADAAPRVVAKGEGAPAGRIREAAVAAGVPVVQRPPLARALYTLAAIGHEIPRQLYEGVAEVLAYVRRMSGAPRRERVA